MTDRFEEIVRRVYTQEFRRVVVFGPAYTLEQFRVPENSGVLLTHIFVLRNGADPDALGRMWLTILKAGHVALPYVSLRALWEVPKLESRPTLERGYVVSVRLEVEEAVDAASPRPSIQLVGLQG